MKNLNTTFLNRFDAAFLLRGVIVCLLCWCGANVVQAQENNHLLPTFVGINAPKVEVSKKLMRIRHIEMNPNGTSCITIGLNITQEMFDAHLLLAKENKASDLLMNRLEHTNQVEFTCGTRLTHGVPKNGDVSLGVTNPMPNVGCYAPNAPFSNASIHPRYNLYVVKTGNNGELILTIDSIASDLDPAAYIFDACTSNATLLDCIDNGGGNGMREYLDTNNLPICTDVYVQVKHWKRSASSNPANCTDCTYTITADVNSTCSAPCSITTSAAQLQPATAGQNNGSAKGTSYGGTGQYNYAWDNGENTRTATALSAGLHTVTATDVSDSNCTATATITITQTGGGTGCTLSVSATQTQAATAGQSNGQATAIATGGSGNYYYNWMGTNNGNGTDLVTGLAAGTYSVVVTDTNLATCTGVASVTITTGGGGNCNGFSATATQVTPSTIGLDNGVAQVTASGGTQPYTYNWGISGQNTAIVTNLATGNYYATVTDANGCTAEAPVVITENNPCANTNLTGSILTTTNAICTAPNGNATVNVSGGTAPYNYLWSTGETTPNVAGRPAGSYSVIVTDANNCTTTINGSILASNPSYVNAVATNTQICAGGSTVISPQGSGAQTYQWSTGYNGHDIIVTAPNIYTVTATDTNGCVATGSVTIAQAPAPTPTITGATAICIGNSTTLTANGGTSLVWSENNAITPTITVTPDSTTTYTIVVTNVNGCSGTAAHTVAVNPLPIVTTTPVRVCVGDTTRTTAVCATGTAYAWTTGATTNTIDIMTIGTYTVTVTDAQGCQSTASVVAATAITTQPKFTTDIQHFNLQILTSTVVAHNPLSYKWDFGDSYGIPTNNINTTNPLPSYIYSQNDTYYITLEEDNGCTVETYRKEVEVEGGTGHNNTPFANTYIPTNLGDVSVSKAMFTPKGLLVVGNTIDPSSQQKKAFQLLVAADGVPRYMNVSVHQATVSGLTQLSNKQFIQTGRSRGKAYLMRIDSLFNTKFVTRFPYMAEQFIQLSDGNLQGWFTDVQGNSYLVQTDILGNVLGVKQVAFGNNSLRIKDAAVVSDGFILVGTNTMSGSQNAFIFKFDNSQNLIWKKALSGTPTNFDIIRTGAQGQIFVGGTNNGEAILVALESNGTFMAGKRLADNSLIKDISVRTDGSLLIATEKRLFHITPDMNSVVDAKELTITGRIFEKAVIHQTIDRAAFVAIYQNKPFIATVEFDGQNNNCAISNTITQRLSNYSLSLSTSIPYTNIDMPTTSGSNYLLGAVSIKVATLPHCITTETLETKTNQPVTSLFPNPAKNLVTIQSSIEITSVSIVDILGETISTQQGNLSTNMQLNIANIANGTYFVQITTKLGTQTEKLVVLK